MPIGEKEPWSDRHGAGAGAGTSRLGLTSADVDVAGATESAENQPKSPAWRERAQRKGTWLGAEISNTRPLAAIAALALLRRQADEAIREEVEIARSRAGGHATWSQIGDALGTSAEAARQRFGLS